MTDATVPPGIIDVSAAGRGRGRPRGEPRPRRRTRQEAADERPHVIRRRVPAKGTGGNGTGVTVYVALDPETFKEVRRRAVKAGSGFSAQVRILVDAGLAVAGVTLPRPAGVPGVQATAKARPAVGATRRKDRMPFSYVKFDHPAFGAVRGRALAEGTSAAEQVRQLVEWGLEG